MTHEQRRYLDAADELYSAVAEFNSYNFVNRRVKTALGEFARACNDWKDHPVKLELQEIRRRGINDRAGQDSFGASGEAHPTSAGSGIDRLT